MDAYQEKQGKMGSDIRFTFDGKHISPADTPEKVSCIFYIFD
jgi:hypothetical protein